MSESPDPHHLDQAQTAPSTLETHLAPAEQTNESRLSLGGLKRALGATREKALGKIDEIKERDANATPLAYDQRQHRKQLKDDRQLAKNMKRAVTNAHLDIVYGEGMGIESDPNKFGRITKFHKSSERAALKAGRIYRKNQVAMARNLDDMPLTKEIAEARERIEKLEKDNEIRKKQRSSPTETSAPENTTQSSATVEQLRRISQDTLDRLSDDTLEEFFINVSQPEVVEGEVVSKKTETRQTNEDIVDADVKTTPKPKQPLTIVQPETFTTDTEPSDESGEVSTEIPTEELEGIKSKISEVTAEMIDYVLNDLREKSGNPNAKLSPEKIAETIKDTRDYVLRKEIVSRFNINQADDTLEKATLEGMAILSDELIDITVQKAADLYAKVEAKVSDIVRSDKSDKKPLLKWRETRNNVWNKAIAELPIEDQETTLGVFRSLKKQADEARIAKREARAQSRAKDTATKNTPAQSYEELLKTVPNA